MDGFHPFRLGVTSVFSAELGLRVCELLGSRWGQLPDLDGPRCLRGVAVVLLWNNAFPVSGSPGFCALYPSSGVSSWDGEARLLLCGFAQVPVFTLLSLHPLQGAGLQGVWACFRRRLLGRPGGGDSTGRAGSGLCFPAAWSPPGRGQRASRCSRSSSGRVSAGCTRQPWSPGGGPRGCLLLSVVAVGAVASLGVLSGAWVRSCSSGSCRSACLFPDQEILGCFLYYH